MLFLKVDGLEMLVILMEGDVLLLEVVVILLFDGNDSDY